MAKAGIVLVCISKIKQIYFEQESGKKRKKR